MEGIIKKSPLELGEVVSLQTIDAYAEAMSNVMHMEDVKAVVDTFNEQEELLSQAKEYSRLRANYAALEAATYRKIVLKGWQDAIGHKQTYVRRAAEWLAETPDYERYIEKILNGDGETLVSVWKHKQGLDLVTRNYSRYVDRKHSILERYESYGEVRIDDLFRETCGLEEEDDVPEVADEYYWHRLQDYPTDKSEQREPDTEIAFGNRRSHMTNEVRERALLDRLDEIEEAIADNTRIALRKRGAVGIGGGTYINPEKCPDELERAMEIRKRNICYCIKKLANICNAIDGVDFITELQKAVKKTKLPIAVVKVEAKGTDTVEAIAAQFLNKE